MDVNINETWNNQAIMQLNDGSVFRKLQRNNTALGNGNVPRWKFSVLKDGRARQNHHTGKLLSEILNRVLYAKTGPLSMACSPFSGNPAAACAGLKKRRGFWVIKDCGLSKVLWNSGRKGDKNGESPLEKGPGVAYNKKLTQTRENFTGNRGLLEIRLNGIPAQGRSAGFQTDSGPLEEMLCRMNI